ncbi:ArsR family transcriptional regulator [Anaerovibrio lipolyticus DSM 3074]|jgi:ArsR family transcriptional regulator|uniref:ArsR family transcriptional regulator n=1 Tax=Anaerovibrio lipolyticus DSM 3074 TaxID=1120997 RepID=A0A1M6BXX5_9FIRM|nr:MULTISPECIES: metalloregulator ArsR/SmtB family transcription factor [Anaerovibrio]SHI53328.1 ArsR family transcriptional regulator [Anaerovibrio lipolyticus DSM 3074]
MIEDMKFLEEQAELLKVIAHPVRLCIARGLWRSGSCNVSHMQCCLEVPQSTVSQHLGKLRQAGIIEGERNGLEITYRLKDERVKAILSCLFSQ